MIESPGPDIVYELFYIIVFQPFLAQVNDIVSPVFLKVIIHPIHVVIESPSLDVVVLVYY